MSNIYSAKFMNEATTTLVDKVFKRPVNETYLFSTMNILREMNNVINENTKKLYIQIAEAESKEDENKLFATYFYEFKNTFQAFANKVQEMKSRMIISVENKVETWDYLFKDDGYIASFDSEFTYKGWNFSHMEESHYPRLNLYKIYQKEFDYLGHLMQDNGIDASPSAKLKIIASVCNNFANCSGDKNWIRNLVNDMVDVDEKELSRSYSECIYNSLRDKYEFTVDKGMLYTCKESLMDYEDIIDAAVKMCDDVLVELDKVSENISSYLFRNNDKKLKIKTDTDGIIDRDYRLDTYSMNQLNIFLKNKINQMRKVLNVFTIAIGIKFDTAVDYISQNIDILKMAKEYNSDNVVDDADDVNSDEDNADNEMIDDVENGEEYEDQPIEDDDESEENNSEEDEENNSDDESEENNSEEDEEKEAIEEEPETSEDDVEDEEPADSLDYDGEEFEESYIFESELFELELMQESYSMYMAVREALLLEEEQNPSSMQNVEKVADKANAWQNIISKLVALWKKFKDAIQTNAKAKIEYLKENGRYIEAALNNVEGTVTLEYSPDFSRLQRLQIPDLNYQAMEDKLVSEEAFCTAYFADYYANKGDRSFADAIKTKILGEPQKIDPKKREYVEKAYDFCIDYMDRTAPIKKQTDLIEKAQRVAHNVSKVQESANDNSFNQYFTEMEDETKSTGDTTSNAAGGNDGKAAAPKSDKAGKLTVYFKVCSQVLAAEMTIYQKIFNEYFKYCSWYIVKTGGPSFGKLKSKNNNQEQTKSADQSANVQTFN